MKKQRLVITYTEYEYILTLILTDYLLLNFGYWIHLKLNNKARRLKLRSLGERKKITKLEETFTFILCFAIHFQTL